MVGFISPVQIERSRLSGRALVQPWETTNKTWRQNVNMIGIKWEFPKACYTKSVLYLYIQGPVPKAVERYEILLIFSVCPKFTVLKTRLVLI